MSKTDWALGLGLLITPMLLAHKPFTRAVEVAVTTASRELIKKLHSQH